MTDAPARYRVFSPARLPGGKLVSVFSGAEGDLQARAAAAGTPLSVFVQDVNVSDVVLRVFTPTREKGESDSGAVAALASLSGRGELLDVADVQMGGDTTPAQLCGGEWLLRQGDVTVQAVATDPVWVSASHARLPVTWSVTGASGSVTEGAATISLLMVQSGHDAITELLVIVPTPDVRTGRSNAVLHEVLYELAIRLETYAA